MEPTPFVNKRANPDNKRIESDGVPVSPGEKKKSLDLNDLFQFTAARQRALERNTFREVEQPFADFVPHRVFINHIDSYHGRHFASYLADRVVGATRVPILEAEDDAQDEDKQDPYEGMTNEELEDMEKEKELEKLRKTEKHNYEIIGTIDFPHYPEYRRTEDISDVINAEDKEEFLSKILSCGFIVYDITNTLYCHPLQIDEATWVLNTIVKKLHDMQKSSPKAFRRYKDCRTFILISTLLTWAKTPPIDPEDPTLPFTEADFRKRKPHPNYKAHFDFEKRVMEAGTKFPANLKTIVIGSGVTYGHDEDVLHFLFKMAWMNAKELPVFAPGRNLIPLIHVDALASILHLICEEPPKRYKYIIAVEQSTTSLKKIVKLISKKLGGGKYIKVNKEEAFLYKEVKQRDYDMLTVNLNMQPGYIVEAMDVKWPSELPFGENIVKTVQEYRTARNLWPIKIFMHGPPASGKTFLARRLAEYYKIHYLNVKEVIQDGIQKIKDRMQEIRDKELLAEEMANQEKENVDIEGEDAAEEEEEEVEEEEEADIETLKEQLNEIEENMNSNERGRLDDQFVIKFFKDKMSSNMCQNQGYVIDGYPKTMEQTRTMYEPEEGEEGGAEEEDETNPQGPVEHLYNAKIMPAFVESLDASDEFLIRRVISIPEKFVQDTHYMEEDMCRRLTEFRLLNTEEITPLIFYDELEVHPMLYNIELDNDPQMEPTFQAILRHVGEPRNYGPEGSELEEVLLEKETKREEQTKETLRAKEAEARIKARERRDEMEHWMFLKDQEKEMEEAALAVLATPLRHYLMKYIFPTLTRGLVEVARVRPDDPVDYLAEFLFRENPEGKMFQPNYDERAEELTKAFAEYQKSTIKTKQKRDDEEDASSVENGPEGDVISNVSEVHERCSHPSLPSGQRLKKMQDQRRTSEDREESSSGSCTCTQHSTDSLISPPGVSMCSCPPSSVRCQCARL